jgi:hypothetical protein
MLEEYESVGSKLDRDDAYRPVGYRFVALPCRTARPGPPASGGHGRSHHPIELASQLELEQPVKIVHL